MQKDKGYLRMNISIHPASWLCKSVDGVVVLTFFCDFLEYFIYFYLFLLAGTSGSAQEQTKIDENDVEIAKSRGASIVSS